MRASMSIAKSRWASLRSRCTTALQAAERSKVFLQIGQQLRYVQPLRETIRKIHEDKIVGEPFVIKAQRHSTPIQPAAELARPEWYKT